MWLHFTGFQLLRHNLKAINEINKTVWALKDCRKGFGSQLCILSSPLLLLMRVGKETVLQKYKIWTIHTLQQQLIKIKKQTLLWSSEPDVYINPAPPSPYIFYTTLSLVGSRNLQWPFNMIMRLTQLCHSYLKQQFHWLCTAENFLMVLSISSIYW